MLGSHYLMRPKAAGLKDSAACAVEETTAKILKGLKLAAAAFSGLCICASGCGRKVAFFEKVEELNSF